MTVADWQIYCYGDPTFFESPARLAEAEGVFGVTRREVPAGWRRTVREVWISWSPEGLELPKQGWKVHVSAAAESAESACSTVWDYCVEHGIAFKHLRGPRALSMYNSKYAPRGSSGKLMALYATSEEQLHTVLTDLSELLRDVRGPHILSDLRWPDSPLFVRYGGFVERYCHVDGEPVLAIERPDGELVPDRRRPVFSVPDWVPVPSFLQEALAARAGGELPYRVTRALHFSNAGGVYEATRIADGRRVVLKEARAFAGLDTAGNDATSRLHTERKILEQLQGLPGVPEYLGHVQVGDHEFLAVEFIEGANLWVWMARQHPMIVHPDPAPEHYREYAERAIAVLERIEAVLRSIHGRGIVFGDLHFGNVIVGADDSVHFVDYELAFEVDQAHRLPLHTMGFSPGPATRGFDIDRYSLASLKAALFLPLEKLRTLDRGKVAQQMAIIRERFPVPEEFLAGIQHDLTTLSGHPADLVVPLEVDLDEADPDWARIRQSMGAAILATATLDRTDRLFPGDVHQFASVNGGASFAYGAAGVLWTLSVTGTGRFPEGEEWLRSAAAVGKAQSPGFYDGLHGLAYTLQHLGYTAEALDAVERARPAVAGLRNTDLFSGLAGIGLHLLHLSTVAGAEHLRDEAVLLGERVTSALRTARTGQSGARKAGLMHGWSGPALFFIRLAQLTGDDGYLDLALQALHLDLDQCVVTRSGSLQVEEKDVRTLAYVEVGSAGIALVADEMLAVRADDRLAEALPRIMAACAPEFVLQSQLFSGRAGLLATLARAGVRDNGLDTAAAVRRHLRRLSWYALSHEGKLAFPGQFSLRLSMDLATGVAGVLLTTAAVTAPDGIFLPFFTPRPVPPRTLLDAGVRSDRTLDRTGLSAGA